jgi:methyl-accepting chemotaxis protein
VPNVQKASDIIQEVSAASSEQSQGVSQVNRAMTQVDQVTQRNASAAEELSSTAEELAAQAESLQQLMGFFRVPESVAYRGAAPSLKTPPQPRAARSVVPTPHVPFIPALGDGNGHGDHEFKRF